MDTSQVIITNIVAILALGSLVALLFSEGGDRLVSFVGGVAFGAWLTFWGWLIYAAIHFIVKYW